MNFIVAVLLCGLTPAHAQEGGVSYAGQLKTEQELLDSRARTYLREHGNKASPADYRDDAIVKIKADTAGTGNGLEYFDYQRVEASGIFAGSETTEFPGLFDGRIQPSQLGAPTDETVLPQWAQRMEHPFEDLAGLSDDSGGQISAYAQAAVAAYKKKKIRDIVAHSWGAEVIYNAIFLGEIDPPKRIIICGVTETDWEKWKALSAYTGTEVIAYDNRLDPWAHTARGLHYADNTVYQFKMTSDPDKLDQMWMIACEAEGRNCNKYGRHGDFQLKAYWGLPTHSRTNYYERLLSDNVLAADAKASNESQDRQVDCEAERMFNRDLEEAREIVRQEQNMKENWRPEPVRPQYEAAPAQPMVMAAPPAQAAAIPAAPPFPAAAYGADLKALVISACDGGSVLPDSGLRALYEFQNVGQVPNSDQVSQGFSGCEKSVYDDLIRVISEHFNSHISSTEEALKDWVVDLAVEARKLKVQEPVLDPNNGRNRKDPPPSTRCHHVTVSLSGRQECW